MNDKQNAQNRAPHKPMHQSMHDQTATSGARNEQVASERKPSKIEPREWRGSGVCGDRHTD